MLRNADGVGASDFPEKSVTKVYVINVTRGLVGVHFAEE